MKYLLMALLLAAPILAQETQPKRIAVTERSTVSTAQLADGMGKKCVGVVLTSDPSKADYMLEATTDKRLKEGTTVDEKIEYTLFAKNGDVLFHTTTRYYGNAMKDVCNFIGAKKK